ncbi:MAG: hypothetical protein R3F14_24710 [Polyangiaceae bacterium]
MALAPADEEEDEVLGPPKPGVPFRSVPTPGTSPLSVDETLELGQKCKAFTDAVVAEAKENGTHPWPLYDVFAVLANPPQIAGVDVPRCTHLMTRDAVARFADTQEREMEINLRWMVVKLIASLEGGRSSICPSAKPVPAKLREVNKKSYHSTTEDWGSEGWRCLGFDLSDMPQFFQYELRTNSAENSFEVIARGYPVPDGPLTELYIEGKIENGTIDPKKPILRR